MRLYAFSLGPSGIEDKDEDLGSVAIRQDIGPSRCVLDVRGHDEVCGQGLYLIESAGSCR
jgi:hypothetical protein